MPLPPMPGAAAPTVGPDHAPPSNAAPDALALLDWTALQARLDAAGAAPDQPRVLSGHGDPRAQWLFICDAPGSAAVTLPTPEQASPAELLLDQMLRACGLSRQSGAYLVYAHHCDDDGSLTRLWLQRVLQTLQPKVVVLMSRPATHSLLQSSEAPGRLRGQDLTCLGVPVVVSYPPALLLGKVEQKARAWADLCRARKLAGPDVALHG
jgi:uracil-DNA glycosylase family 4